MPTLEQLYDLKFEKLEILVLTQNKGMMQDVEKKILFDGFLKFTQNSLIIATLETKDDTNITTNAIFNLDNIGSFRITTKTTN